MRALFRKVFIVCAIILYTLSLLCIGYCLPHKDEEGASLETAALSLIESYNWEMLEVKSISIYDLYEARGLWEAARQIQPYNLTGIEFNLDQLYENVPRESAFFYAELEKWPTIVSNYEYYVKNPFDEKEPLVCQICFFDLQLGIARVYPDVYEFQSNCDTEIEWPPGAWSLDTPKKQISTQYKEYVDFLKANQVS